jgi:threonine dehydrogenase-like Zn-dependent dehydrogenase
MSKMRVMQGGKVNGPFQLVERPIPEPGTGSVRIRVEACGICHSDSFTKEGTWPGISRPARARRRGVRAHDERRCAVSRRADQRVTSNPTSLHGTR